MKVRKMFRHTEETKKRISQTHLGMKPTKETRKKLVLSHTGKKFSEEIRRKMSESRKGRVSGMLGKKHTLEARRKITLSLMGRRVREKCHFWKGGVSTQNELLRHGVQFRLWREAVFARDGWTCQKCKVRGGNLHSHHIKYFSQYPELRFAIDNGITLCISCHREIHRKEKNG